MDMLIILKNQNEQNVTSWYKKHSNNEMIEALNTSYSLNDYNGTNSFQFTATCVYDLHLEASTW